MSARTWEVVLFVAALACALGFAWYYVRGVLDGDRGIARASAVGFFVLSVAAIATLLQVLG